MERERLNQYVDGNGRGRDLTGGWQIADLLTVLGSTTAKQGCCEVAPLSCCAAGSCC